MKLPTTIEHFDVKNQGAMTDFEIKDWEWPIPENENGRLLTCECCHYPVALERHSVDQIKNDENTVIAYIVPVRHLLKEIRVYFDPADPQKTPIECPSCGNFFTLIHPYNQYGLSLNDIRHIRNYQPDSDEQFAMLIVPSTLTETPRQAKSEFDRISGH